MASPNLSWIELCMRLGTALACGAAIAVGTEDKHTVIKATLAAHERTDSQVEQIASRLTLERDIVGVSWRALPTATVE
jgi:hypothetical protein